MTNTTLYKVQKCVKRITFALAMMIFSTVAVAQDSYKNPVDGKTYIANWKTYVPAAGIKTQSGRVANSGVRLLSTHNEFESNVTVSELAKLISYIQESLVLRVKAYKQSGEIMLQISLYKEGKPDFKIAHQGDLPDGLLQEFYESLGDIALNTKQSTVTLQVQLAVKNG